MTFKVYLLLSSLAISTGAFLLSRGAVTSAKTDSADSAVTTPASADTGTLRQEDLRKIANKAFRRGELLKFDVNYGIVTAGEATMKVSDTVMRERKCYKVEFTLRSKPFFDIFYRVADSYSTILDSQGIFPWHFEQHIREGGYSRDYIADFDQLDHVAITEKGKRTIPPYVHDIMSAFYYARTVDYIGVKPGQVIRLQNFYKDSTNQLDVRNRGKQTIEVEAGKFNCIVVEPLVREGGLFKSEGKIFIWLTDDDRKLPIRVNSKIPIGSVDSELIAYYGLNGALDAKVNGDK